MRFSNYGYSKLGVLVLTIHMTFRKEFAVMYTEKIDTVSLYTFRKADSVKAVNQGFDRG